MKGEVINHELKWKQQAAMCFNVGNYTHGKIITAQNISELINSVLIT